MLDAERKCSFQTPDGLAEDGEFGIHVVKSRAELHPSGDFSFRDHMRTTFRFGRSCLNNVYVSPGEVKWSNRPWDGNPGSAHAR